jgi:hypothetical protein
MLVLYSVLFLFVHSLYASEANSWQMVAQVKTKKARSIYYSDGYIYIADDRGGIKIVDPKADDNHLIATYKNKARYFDVIVVDNYLYASTDKKKIEVYDISNKKDIQKIAQIQTSSTVMDMIYQDGYLYIADRGAGIKIVDVSSPTNPRILSTMDTRLALGVAIKNDTLFVADGKNGVLFVDISDKTDPKLITQIKTQDKTRAIKLRDDKLYVATRYKGLTVIDISDISHPKVSDVIDTDGKAINVTLDDNLIYISDSNNGLVVLNQDTLDIENHLDIHTKLRDVVLSDGYMFLGGNNGLKIYKQSVQKPKEHTNGLKLLSNDTWMRLSHQERLYVAHKLFASLFYNTTPTKFNELVDRDDFPSYVYDMFHQSVTQSEIDAIESQLDYFSDYTQGDAGRRQISRLLAKLYMLNPSQYYLNRWSAYILTQTILFSPAIELNTVLNEDAIIVYNDLVDDLDKGLSIADSTYNHVISQSNWRRFRSPEDNGREMLEIYLMDFNDSHVPLAAKALQNWHLDRKKNLIINSDKENGEVISDLFPERSVINGYDYYDALVADSRFLPTVTLRLVEIYFPNFTSDEQHKIVDSILALEPTTWTDLLFDIVFSEKYLLQSHKLCSFEEIYFPMIKALPWIAKANSFEVFQVKLIYMKQASMRYKLGRPVTTADDTDALAWQQRAIRSLVLLNPNEKPDDNSSMDDGIDFNHAFTNLPEELIAEGEFDEDNRPTQLWYEQERVRSDYLVDLYLSALNGRNATEEEKKQLGDLIDNRLYDRDKFKNRANVNLYYIDSTDRNIYSRGQFVYIVLDYISRLSNTYEFQAIKGDE